MRIRGFWGRVEGRGKWKAQGQGGGKEDFFSVVAYSKGVLGFRVLWNGIIRRTSVYTFFCASSLSWPSRSCIDSTYSILIP